jgi:hypothetical protein
LRAPKRLWALFLSAQVGVFAWYTISHQDRYLQALLPWFAACTAAAIALAWRSGVWARMGVAALVTAQVVWGGDLPFVRSHRMMDISHLHLAIDRIASGFDRDYTRRHRFLHYNELVDAGRALPPSAKVLVHEEHLHLGLQHASVNDSPDWQGGISYGRFPSPAALDDGLRGLGITHILVTTGLSKDEDALPGDIVFFDYITHFARRWRTFGAFTIFELPSTRPSGKPYGDILWLGCENLYKKGRYSMTDMMSPFRGNTDRNPYPPPRVPVSGNDVTELDTMVNDVDAVAVDSVCQGLQPSKLAWQFVSVPNRGSLRVWVRRRTIAPALQESRRGELRPRPEFRPH